MKRGRILAALSVGVLVLCSIGCHGAEGPERRQAEMDSLSFQSEEEEKVGPFQYYYGQTGLRFTVPEGWVERPLSGESEGLIAEFSPADGGGASILFGCEDHRYESRGLSRTRADLDNSLLIKIARNLPKKEFAALLFGEGPQVEEVSVVTYGGRKYVKVALKNAADVYGAGPSGDLTAFFRLDYGFFYCFQFSGTEASLRYSDFEALLSSAYYPSDASGVIKGMVIGGTLIVALLFLPSFWAEWKKRKRLPEASKPGKDLCRQCGRDLSPGSAYCPYCGTKITKEELP